MNNVMMIEFTQDHGEVPVEYVALFNSLRISEETVRDLIYSGIPSSEVIIVTKKQYLNVFFNDKKGESK